MHFTAPFATLALLAASALAFPNPTKRDANSDAVSSLETASSQMASKLSTANTQLQTLFTSGSGNPPNGGILAVTVQNVINNIEEGITLFQNIASGGAGSDAETLADSMQTELTSLKGDVSSAQTTLGGLDAADEPISVNGIDELLGALIPGISDLFNEVVAIVEDLDLPPL